MNMPPQQYGAGPNPPTGQPPTGHPHVGQPPPPGFGPPPYGYGAPVAPQYEFTPDQNEIVEKAASRTRALGILLYIQAALQLPSNILMAIADFYIGHQYHQGGSALERVVTTQGNDVGNLMEALDKISSAFQWRLILVAIFLGLTLLIAMMVGGIALSALAELSRQGGL